VPVWVDIYSGACAAPVVHLFCVRRPRSARARDVPTLSDRFPRRETSDPLRAHAARIGDMTARRSLLYKFFSLSAARSGVAPHHLLTAYARDVDGRETALAPPVSAAARRECHVSRAAFIARDIDGYAAMPSGCGRPCLPAHILFIPFANNVLCCVWKVKIFARELYLVVEAK
jgi:hypothetical protein